jgi:cation transporter-like permease
MADINRESAASARLRQDMRAHDGEIPPRHATTGRMFLGYCLTIAAPAIGWTLADLGMIESSARIIALAVMTGGALLLTVGSMARFGYNGADHHVFGL